MSSDKFDVFTHEINSQHIREYPHATLKSETAQLKLQVKEYRPRGVTNPEPDSVTIIGLHANGFPKETYEPLWDELLDCSRAGSLKIRAIWIADCSHQGASGVINEHEQGDDPSWFDHSRDLLHMVNEFRSQMVPPIVGIGHSMGVGQLVQLAIIHPRLLHSVALIEPVIQDRAADGPNPGMFASFRPDLWASRKVAASGTLKHPMFRSMDPRVLDIYNKYGYRELPTALHPDMDAVAKKLAKAKAGASDAFKGAKDAEQPVTLTTTKHQEAWSYSRAVFDPQTSDVDTVRERLLSPDLDPREEGAYVFVRPEILNAYLRLPELRPAALWLYGDNSPINVPDLRAAKLETTGTGRGGSGGAKLGKVKEIVVEDAGHMLPFEKPALTARILDEWLTERVRDWKDEQKFYEELQTGRSDPGRKKMSRKYVAALGEDMLTKRDRHDSKL